MVVPLATPPELDALAAATIKDRADRGSPGIHLHTTVSAADGGARRNGPRIQIFAARGGYDRRANDAAGIYVLRPAAADDRAIGGAAAFHVFDTTAADDRTIHHASRLHDVVAIPADHGVDRHATGIFSQAGSAA